MSNIIKRPATGSEIHSRIIEKLNDCMYFEKINSYEKDWVKQIITHPDKHFYEILEQIFRPVIENEIDLWKTLSNFFNSCGSFKNGKTNK